MKPLNYKSSMTSVESRESSAPWALSKLNYAIESCQIGVFLMTNMNETTFWTVCLI